MKKPLTARFAAACAVALAGCSGPNKANVELRKQNQDLKEEVRALKERTEADGRLIRGLRERSNVTPTLPADRLERLFTVQGLKFGRLTGGADLDRGKSGDEGLRVQVAPTDAAGDALKAAGTFTIEAFDTALEKGVRIGRWEINLDEAKASWRGGFGQYNYTFELPWQTPPQHENLHVEATFLDELTQTPIKQSTDVKIDLPTAASTTSATQ